VDLTPRKLGTFYPIGLARAFALTRLMKSLVLRATATHIITFVSPSVLIGSLGDAGLGTTPRGENLSHWIRSVTS
jgi:hypothetical protein